MKTKLKKAEVLETIECALVEAYLWHILNVQFFSDMEEYRVERETAFARLCEMEDLYASISSDCSTPEKAKGRAAAICLHYGLSAELTQKAEMATVVRAVVRDANRTGMTVPVPPEVRAMGVGACEKAEDVIRAIQRLNTD